jgi:hypothetical protein
MSGHPNESTKPDGPEPTPPPRDRNRPLTPTVMLLLVLGAILLAIGLWTGGNDRGLSTAPAAPAQLTIVDPVDSAEVAAPLEVTFSTTAPLHLTPTGWQATRYHLHALIDGTSVMPGALDLHDLGEGHFRWRIKGMAPGSHTLRLVWARPDHRAIPEGASDEVEFELR